MYLYIHVHTYTIYKCIHCIVLWNLAAWLWITQVHCIHACMYIRGKDTVPMHHAMHYSYIHMYKEDYCTCNVQCLENIHMPSHRGLHLSVRDFFSINLPLYRCRQRDRVPSPCSGTMMMAQPTVYHTQYTMGPCMQTPFRMWAVLISVWQHKTLKTSLSWMVDYARVYVVVGVDCGSTVVCANTFSGLVRHLIVTLMKLIRLRLPQTDLG